MFGQKTTPMNNRLLLLYHGEIQQMLKRQSIFAIWNAGKIKEFYRTNELRINRLLERSRALDLEYFESYEDGNLKTDPKTGKQIFREGKTAEQWQRVSEDFMNEEIHIVL